MKNSIFLVLNWIMHSVRSTIRASQNRNRNNMYHHRSSNVCSNKEYGRSSSNNQCMSSPMQLLNPEAEQHLVRVGDGFYWMMLAVLEMNLASLSAEVVELVFTTVDTLRMLVLRVQVRVIFSRLLTQRSTIHAQHNDCPLFYLSFLRNCHSWPHQTILRSFRRRPTSYLFGNH